MPLLEVRICGARNLKDTQIFGKIDPFCTVEFEGKKWHTEAHNNTTNPEWNADFKFHVADENSSRLHFTVWDKNPVSNDFLGEYHYSISGLERGRVDDKWVLLQQCKGNAELHIQVKAVDFGIIRDQYQQQQGYPQQGYPPQQGHHHHHHHQEQQFNQPPYHGVERVFGRPVRLRTHHGTFVRAYPGRDAKVDIKGEHPAEWEQFIIEPHGNGAISIRTHHGTWLRGNQGGEGAKVDTQPDGVREWEEWHIEQAPGGNGWFHLRSHHGTRLRCFPGPDGSRVDLQSNQPGEWERIQIIPA